MITLQKPADYPAPAIYDALHAERGLPPVHGRPAPTWTPEAWHGTGHACPCCGRDFDRLSQHIATAHPEYAKGER